MTQPHTHTTQRAASLANAGSALLRWMRATATAVLAFTSGFALGAPFTQGNLTLLRADSATLNNTTATLVEINATTAGQTAAGVQAISIDGASLPNAIRISGSASSTGYLSRSQDGTLLSFGGHNGTATTPTNANTITPRAVGTFNANGVFALGATYTGTSGNQVRGATSLNNTTWFVAEQGGIYTNGATAASPSGNLRNTKAFGGAVYVGQASATVTNIQVSTVSAATGGTITGLPGLANNASLADFHLISSGDNGSAFDVLYVVSSTGATAGSIAKYSLVSGSWVANGSYTTAFGGFGLTAADNGNGALLYVSTGTGATPANNVLKIADTAGFNAAIAITTASNVTLYTAPAGTVVKGVAFAPVALPELAVSVSAPATVMAGANFDYTISATNSGLANANGVAVNFTIPEGLSFVSASGTGGFSGTNNSGVVNFTGGAINAAGSATLTVTVTATASGSYTAPAGAAVIDPAGAIAESNEANNASTTAATTAALQAPAITTQPTASQTIASGGSVTLTVAASGFLVPTFQWYEGLSGVTTNPIGGATSASFTTPALMATKSYWARATNASGTADSNTALVNVSSADANLSALTLSAGTLAPPFAGATTSYSASVPNATTMVTLTPTTSDTMATVTVNGTAVVSGTASGNIALNPGPNVITAVVTAQDMLSTKTYTVTVTRLSNNADLSNLALSAGTLAPVFDSGTIAYTASVSNATTSVMITPTVSSPAATVTINGNAVVSGNAGTVNLNVGPNNVAVVVTAEDMTMKTYTVVVTRAASSDANLSALALSSGAISPVFGPATTSYVQVVPNATASLTVTPTVAEPNATITVNGGAVVSGSASGVVNLVEGINTITTIVTAQDTTTTKTYTAKVIRQSNATLAPGSIAFTGFNADGDDNLAFAALVDIPVNTVIFFTDDEWNGTDWADANESAFAWVASSNIPAGTIVAMDLLNNTHSTVLPATSNFGTIVAIPDATNNPGVSASDEIIFAFQGTGALNANGNEIPTAFLAAIANETGETPPIGAGYSLDNTGLSEAAGTAIIFTEDDDGMRYKGPRNGKLNFSDYLTDIADRVNNWESVLGGDGTTYVPFSPAPFTAGPTVIITINDVTVNEGNSGTTNLTFTVTRGNATGAFTVDYATANSTATVADNDYVAATGTVSFTVGGPLTQQFTVSVNGDALVELNERVFVNLSNVVNTVGNAVISDAQGIGTILTDDPVAPSITTHPVSPTIATGTQAFLSVVVEGFPAPTFQWYSGLTGDVTNPISGATLAGFTTPALLVNTDFWVRVTNTEGFVDSNAATITVALGAPLGSANVNVLIRNNGTWNPAGVNVGGTQFVNLGLQGMGRVPASAIDPVTGESLGSISDMQITGWKKNLDGSYSGTLNTLPDRGYNATSPTTIFSNYAARINSFAMTFAPYTAATPTTAQNQIALSFTGSTRFTYDHDGLPGTAPVFTTGLLANGGTSLFGTTVPVRTGDSTQSDGTVAERLTLDSEGLILDSRAAKAGAGWIGDEYGANIYHFNAAKQIDGLLRMPAALVPHAVTGGPVSFIDVPANVDGRRINQGMEGIAQSPDGTLLFGLLQSATIQDTGTGNQGRFNTRLMVYDISSSDTPTDPVAQYVIQLPRIDETGLTTNGTSVNRTGAQSAIIALNDHQLLILSRDGNGRGVSGSASPVFKSVLLADLSNATNIDGTYDAAGDAVAPLGVLAPTVTPIEWSQALNMIGKLGLGISEVEKFGMNLLGGNGDINTMCEKWESLGMVSANDAANPNDYFLFIGNDNDFLTATGKYLDAAGAIQTYDVGLENDTIVLAYRVRMTGAFNQAPFVSNAIPAQNLVTSSSVTTFAFAVDTFTDPEAGVLAYTATQADGSPLPTWLSFDSNTRTFGVNGPAIGTMNLKVTATDSGSPSLSVSTEFALTLNTTATFAFGSGNGPVSLASLVNYLPSGGTFSGTGVTAGVFNPAVAGPGAHTITYSYTDALGAPQTATFNITVNYTLQVLHYYGESGLLGIQTAPIMGAMIDRLDNDYSNTVVLAEGDSFIPGPWLIGGADPSLNAIPVIGSTALGRPDIAIMNAFGTTASAIGNHEFDLGSPVFSGAVFPAAPWVGAQFPLLTVNLDFTNDSSLKSRADATLGGTGGAIAGLEVTAMKAKIAPYAIKTLGGQKIGIVGATTWDLLTKSSPNGTVPKDDANAATSDLQEVAAYLQAAVDSLRALGVNKIILVDQLDTLQRDKDIAPLVSGIDIMVAGGGHERMGDATDTATGFNGHDADFIADAYPIVTAGADGKPMLIVTTDTEYTYLGRLVADFDANGELILPSLNPVTNGAYVATEAKLQAVYGTTDSAAQIVASSTIGTQVKAITDAINSVIIAKDSNVFGYTNVYLEGDRVFGRTQEVNLGDITADANLQKAKAALGLGDTSAVFSLKNGGGLRASLGSVLADGSKVAPLANAITGKPAGGISQLDVENALRFDNKLMVCDMTPAGLLSVLNFAAGLSSGPTVQSGGYSQVGNIRYSYDSARPAGQKVRTVALINDANQIVSLVVQNGAVLPTAPALIQSVALNFTMNGGDNYPIKYTNPPTNTTVNSGCSNFRFLLTNGTLSAPVARNLDFTAATTFTSLGLTAADILGEQKAFQDYLSARHSTPGTAYNIADTAVAFDTRIQQFAQNGNLDTVNTGALYTSNVFIGSASVVEGNSGTVTVNLPVTHTVNANGNTAAFGVSYAVTGGTATAGTDFATLAAGTLTFPAGGSSQNVTLTINGDTVLESSETIIVTLSNVVNTVGTTTIIGTGTGTATITNDDTIPVVYPAGNEYTSTVKGSIALAGAEIPAFDPLSKRAFASSNVGIQVVDLTNPATPTLITTITPATLGVPGLTSNDVTSVTVRKGAGANPSVLAAAIISVPKTAPGYVIFLNAADGTLLGSTVVGANPDNLTFTPDGTKVLVANEAELDGGLLGNADVALDTALGSVSIIDVSGGFTTLPVATADFTAYDSQVAALRAAGVRIFKNAGGTDAIPSRDFEPEYIAVSPDGTTAMVTLQEANALGVLDIATATFTSIVPLGKKDFSPMRLDFSDRDGPGGAALINPTVGNPVFGLYMPDAIASYSVGGQTYYVTANEGDDRNDFLDPDETTTVGAVNYVLDPTVFPNAAALKNLASLGRLTVSNSVGLRGDTDGDGDIDEILAYGGRSFSIYNSAGVRVFDSGDMIDLIVMSQNFSNFDDTRSDNKGSEPEGVTIATLGARTYAFIGLERSHMVLMFDITNPTAPTYTTAFKRAGDLNPEGLVVVQAADSPNGKPLLITASEVSNTLTVFEINDNTAPTISPVSIASNNVNPARAKMGDAVTLSFSANEPIATPTVTLFGSSVTATNVSGNDWAATVVVGAGTQEGAATFTISANDLAGNPALAVSATTDASTVIVDKTTPVIAPVALTSTNINPIWAKVGDTVTLTFTASETVVPVVTLLGETVTATSAGNDWTATMVVGAATPEGLATFSIAVSDLTGNAAALVTATSNASSVNVDRTAPTLTLPANITRGATSVAGAIVTYTASASGATTSSFTPVSGSIFPIGVTTVNATASDAAGNATTGSFTVTVNPGVSIAAASTSEGNSGTKILNLPVSRTDTSTAFTVNYAATGGTATAGTDFTLAAGTLTFNVGDGTQQIAITVIGDTAVESAETVIVTLSGLVNVTGTTTIATASASGTITNDDTIPVVYPAANTFTSTVKSSINLAGAEIPAFDPLSKRAFASSNVGIQVVDLTNPAAPTLITTITPATLGVPGLTSNDVTSVTVRKGSGANPSVLAAAIIASPKTDPGYVVFLNAADGTLLGAVQVGSNPDNLTFTPDGTKVLVANEAELDGGVLGNADVAADTTLGTVSIIDVSGGFTTPVVMTADFTAYDTQVAALKAAGVRIFNNGTIDAIPSRDFEPEYIAVAPDGLTAMVTLQEANAVAILDIATATFTSIKPLGKKDFSPLRLDFSDRDGPGGVALINPTVGNPVFGLYMPDAIASYSVAGQTYYVMANEGDDRNDFLNPDETTTVGAANYVLDPTVFPNAAALKNLASLGRLTVSNSPGLRGDIDNDGDVDEILAYGGRSFSIVDAAGNRVFDSGDMIDLIVMSQNFSNFDDTRSDNKGSEPEGVTIATFGSQTYAFIGLERAHMVLMFDITNPLAPTYTTAFKRTGDLNPEGLIVVSAADSPNGKPLLITASEVSNTLTVFEINAPAGPVLTLPANIVAEATSAAGAIVTYVASAADAASGVATSSFTPESGSVFPLGITMVNASATDNAGNVATGSFTVTVSDTLAPVVMLNGPATVTVEASGSYTELGATGSDIVSGMLTPAINSSAVNVNVPGSYPVFYTVTDGVGLTASTSRTVNVVDTTAPVVAAHGNVTVEATSEAGAVVTYAAGSATDAVTGSPTITYSKESGEVFPVGETTVTITATDAAGNTGTGSFTVTVQALMPGTLAFANATPSANPVNGSGALNTVPVLITRSGGTSGAITVQVVPSQPATTPTGFAKYVYGTDYQFVSGTVAGSTVSFAAGQASATVDVLLKTPVLTKKGQLKLTLASTTGGAAIGSPAAATLTINARDIIAPTLVLNTPVAGATFDITGTVKDAGGLASLTVKVNGATLPLTVDPVTGYVANAIAPYSVLGAIAENGANVIIVTAKDLSGNTSTMTKAVTYLNNRPALTGTYTALIKPTSTPDGDTTGFLTATLSVAGKITGKVTLSGVTIAFTGLLNNAGVATFGTTNAASLDLIDSSEFDAYLGALAFSVSTPDGLVGVLTTRANGGTILATCAGTKTPYSSLNLVPAGLLTTATKGVYTVAFPSKEQSPVLTASAYPQGDGYATLTLTNAGTITVLGKLADGTPLSASGNLRADGTLPLFATLYKKHGLVAGDLTFADLANSDLSGSDLIWIRPNQRTARYYRFGWETGIRIDAVGAKYITPAALDFGQGAVEIVNGNAALVFTDGQLAATITHNVNVAPTTGAVTHIPATGAPYKLTLTASTGVFTGTFTHGADTDQYYGVLINKGANKGGFGYFLNTVPLIYGASGESGGVSLQP